MTLARSRAASLGATRVTIFRRIVLPALLPAITAGAALSFARAIGEYGSLVLLSGNLPNRTEVASVRIDDYAGARAMTRHLLELGHTRIGFIEGDPKHTPARLRKQAFLDTMAEAALTLCSCDPDVLTGRIAFSLQLLLELRRPVRGLDGDALVVGWQPEDLPAVISAQEQNLAESGWPDAYTFGRPHSPRP